MSKLKPDQPDAESVFPVNKRAKVLSRTPRGFWFPACAGKTKRLLVLEDEVWDGFQSGNQSKIFSESNCQTSVSIRNSKILTTQAVSSVCRQDVVRYNSLHCLDLRTADKTDAKTPCFFPNSTQKFR